MRKASFLTTVSLAAIIAAPSAVVAQTNNSVASNVSAETLSNAWLDLGRRSVNRIQGSFDGASGIIHAQENNGDANAINAATAVQANVQEGDTLTTANATVDGRSAGNGLGTLDLAATDPERSNLIGSSFQDASGVATAQQNNGDGNTVAAATSVSADTGDNGDTNQTAAATGTVANGTLDYNSDRRNRAANGALNDFQGVTTVQQNNGDGNVIGSSTSVAANVGPGDVNQTVRVDGGVADTVSFDGASDFQGTRRNAIDGAAKRLEGVASVQQNNGDNNVLGQATAVYANTGASTGDGNRETSDQTAVTTGGSVQGGTLAEAPGDPTTDRSNAIDNGSFNNSAGIVSVQQNNGSNNVMGQGKTVAVTQGSSDDIDAVDRSTARTGGLVQNVGSYDGVFVAGQNRDNSLRDTFRNSRGIVDVQQNNGDQNVMGTSMTVTASLRDGPAEGGANNTAAGSATVNSNVAVDDSASDRTNGVRSGAFDDVKGIASVQQNNGNNNVIGGAVSVTADVDGTPSTEPVGSDDGFGPAMTQASLSANVSGNGSLPAGTAGTPGYTNTVKNSFDDAKGIVSVTQNNGDNNAVQSAVSVSANTAPTGDFGSDGLTSGF